MRETLTYIIDVYMVSRCKRVNLETSLTLEFRTFYCTNLQVFCGAGNRSLCYTLPNLFSV